MPEKIPTLEVVSDEVALARAKEVIQNSLRGDHPLVVAAKQEAAKQEAALIAAVEVAIVARRVGAR